MYIACSLDGKIADKNGSVDWLHEIPNQEKSDYGYSSFFNSIDTTLMGNKTYQQVSGFDEPFPYTGTKNYVITKDPKLNADENVEFIHENLVDFIRYLKRKPGKNIWCIGGGELNALLINNNLLDEIQIFIMPIVLGLGIPLTSKLEEVANLQTIKTVQHSSGVVEVHYSCH